MKKLIISICIIYSICLMVACGANNNSNVAETDSLGFTQDSDEQVLPEGKKYGIKSGIITFESSGSDYLKGSKDIVYFDDNGAKEVTEGYSNGKLTNKAISKGDGFIYNIFYDKKECKKDKAEGLIGIEEQFDNSNNTWSDFKKEQYQFKKLPNQLILGKTCQSFSTFFMDIKKEYSGWNGILLKKETRFKSMDGDSIIEISKAVKFEENVAIPEQVWEIPKGFKILEK